MPDISPTVQPRTEFVLGICVLATAWAAAPGQAQASQLGRYGFWNVYSTITPAGRNVCGMVARISQGRRLHIQHVRGSNFIVFHAYKNSWTIPQGTRVRISMRIDGGVGWVAPQATGRRNSVHWTMRTGLPRFEAAFRIGARLTVTFPQGSEAPWSVSLDRASEAVGRLVACMRDSGNGPTQPFGAPPTPPTQPFSSPAPQSPSGKSTPIAPLRSPPVQGQSISF